MDLYWTHLQAAARFCELRSKLVLMPMGLT